MKLLYEAEPKQGFDTGTGCVFLTDRGAGSVGLWHHNKSFIYEAHFHYLKYNLLDGYKKRDSQNLLLVYLFIYIRHVKLSQNIWLV